MKYSFKPAGFEPPPRQRTYRQKTNELEKKLEEWLNEWKDDNWTKEYARADEQFRNISAFSLDEAHAAVIVHQDYKDIENAGYWLSAAYNKSKESVIRYDLTLESIALDGIGYRLHKEKTLVNVGTAGDRMGYDAKGAVVNVGTAGDWMGYDAKGAVVNVGRAGNWMGEDVEGAVIALKDPKSYGYLGNAKFVLKEEDCKQLPELKDYLERMKKAFEGLRNAPVEQIGEVMKEWSQKNIEAKIQKILRRRGYRSKRTGKSQNTSYNRIVYSRKNC